MDLDEIRNSAWWIDAYKQKNALWIHDNNPKRPHALLTSGNHSNGFFNSREVIPDEVLLRKAASDLIDQFGPAFTCQWLVQGVVGPQTGATKLAELLSLEINSRRSDVEEKNCFWVSPYKSNGLKKQMVFTSEDMEKIKGSYVFLCEDVLTTGGSIQLTEDAIHGAKGQTHSFILTLVNRTGLRVINGKIIIALIDQHMPIWTPEKCPLCQVDSVAIRPKGENWASLNAEY